MEISTITITAEASKAYQKYCCSLTASNLVEGDLETLKEMVINEAVKGINELAGNIGSTENTVPNVRTTVQQPNNPPRYMNNGGNSYRNTVPNTAPVNNNNGGYSQPQQYGNTTRFASEKQINYLKSFGYTGATNITFEQADALLKQYKNQH